MIERTSIGLDVHARSIVGTALDGVTGETFKTTMTPVSTEVIGWVRSLPGPVAVVYEAGPTGYGLYRDLTAAGIKCTVAAPSKAEPSLGRPGQDRRP